MIFIINEKKIINTLYKAYTTNNPIYNAADKPFGHCQKKQGTDWDKKINCINIIKDPRNKRGDQNDEAIVCFCEIPNEKNEFQYEGNSDEQRTRPFSIENRFGITIFILFVLIVLVCLNFLVSHFPRPLCHKWS